jgi:hypothetical protein
MFINYKDNDVRWTKIQQYTKDDNNTLWMARWGLHVGIQNKRMEKGIFRCEARMGIKSEGMAQHILEGCCVRCVRL